MCKSSDDVCTRLSTNSASDDVCEQFLGTKPVTMNLNLLSYALTLSKTHIKRLIVDGISSSIKTTATLESLFSSLTVLSLKLPKIGFMELHSSRRVSGLIKLLTCASQTLEDLTVSGNQFEGEKDLNRLFAEPSDDATATTAPLVFPKMKKLRLKSFILYTPSLNDFLSQQPTLRHVDFKRIHLATTGYEWSDVAKAMPASCTSFRVDDCSHKLKSPSNPVAVHHLNGFKPFSKDDAFDADAGWQANERLFKEEYKDVGFLQQRIRREKPREKFEDLEQEYWENKRSGVTRALIERVVVDC